jgi:4-amino-4-deoxy-L-arabinose transferase-like glycosyltransferase
LVLISASRSIPDILLVLFLTVSAWGFLEILVSVEPRKRYYWMAYLGAALAFEPKVFRLLYMPVPAYCSCFLIRGRPKS